MYSFCTAPAFGCSGWGRCTGQQTCVGSLPLPVHHWARDTEQVAHSHCPCPPASYATAPTADETSNTPCCSPSLEQPLLVLPPAPAACWPPASPLLLKEVPGLPTQLLVWVQPEADEQVIGQAGRQVSYTVTCHLAAESAQAIGD